MQSLIFTLTPADNLQAETERMSPRGGIFVLCDENTARLAYPRLAKGCPALEHAHLIVVPTGDSNKNLTNLSRVWEQLQQHGATRHSLLINLGGGMVTDMGGFAAATFKRGMRWINVPTTLLGAVDAAVGGKTGINFHGLKNEIGVFAEAASVIISPIFFDTLPHKELLSGYAEMLKHALLQSKSDTDMLLEHDVTSIDPIQMLELLRRSVAVKQRIVEIDPHEKGLRKSLNLGHTFGHAFESFYMNSDTPVPHGYAVAWGLVCALVMSHLHLQFDASLLRKFAQYVERNYGVPQIRCTHYDSLLDLMRHDKKNTDSTHIQFTLLNAPGSPEIAQEASEDDIKTTLDLMRDLLHI